ncbi:hypothetical protein F4820DRAFT_109527 [Hypoxylon rubiginosum]|uniref:Uncharacterized protein n=1 Tax=Hypoxylon rubiginosum TaxID=110542 RepID=A0ACB9YLW6_9PEZI|nr:hypothetical protein F4820DRAFT_109527 [Hypoxylon rubiginosum]
MLLYLGVKEKEASVSWYENFYSEAEGSDSTQSNNLGSVESFGLFEFPTRPSQPSPPSLTAAAHSVEYVSPSRKACIGLRQLRNNIIAVHGLSGAWRTTWSAPSGCVIACQQFQLVLMSDRGFELSAMTLITCLRLPYRTLSLLQEICSLEYP